MLSGGSIDPVVRRQLMEKRATSEIEIKEREGRKQPK